MPESQRVPDKLDDRLFDILERLHAAGSVMALYEVVAYCLEHQVQVPDWALASVLRVLKQTVSGGLPKSSGRAAAGFARERQDLIHLLRWDLVHELLRFGMVGRRIFETGYFCDFDRMKAGLRRIGKNRHELFECASQFSEGTLLAAGPEAFRASYRRVERDMRNTPTARKYYLFDHRTLGAFDLATLVEPIPVKKFMEFFHSAS